MRFTANLNLNDEPFLAGAQGMTSDTMESYSNGVPVNGLNGGNKWAGPFVDRSNYIGVSSYDTMEEYTNGAAVDGLNGFVWNGPYADRTNYTGVRASDTFESYGTGSGIGGLNGGTGFAGAYTGYYAGVVFVFAPDSATLPVNVAISTTGTASTTSLYYTTDGSLPTTSSPVYTSPVPFAVAGTLTAMSGGGGYEPDYSSPFTVPFDAAVIDWSNRVVANGGAAPSLATLGAMNVFYKALQAIGLGLFKSVCCFVPDNLIAATTPLVHSYGNDPWTNHNFVAGDLTVNGIQGDGSSKYLDTGVIPSIAFASVGTGGLTLYCSVYVSSTGIDMNAGMSGDATYTNVMTLYIAYSDGHMYCDLYAYPTGRMNAVNTSWAGFLSANRTSTSAAAVYKANSTTSFATLASETTGGATLPTGKIFCMAANLNGPNYYSKHRFSFSAIHDGLTSAQSQALYTAVQALRTTLGGGFV